MTRAEYTTVMDALDNTPDGDQWLLVRFDVDGVVSYEWLTDLDVAEYGAYGNEDLIEDVVPIALVAASDVVQAWLDDDLDNQ